MNGAGSRATPRSRRIVLAALALAAAAPAAAQQPVSLATEFQVNDVTSLHQSLTAVDHDAQGNFVVVWGSTTTTSSGTDTGYTGSVQARRFGSDGAPLGPQFQVNSYTTGSQNYPAVAVEPDGDFVVVWESLGSVGDDTSAKSIQAQRYASDGAPRGGQFQVNVFTTNAQRSPRVGVDAEGDFVVVWRSLTGPSDPSDYAVMGRRFASDGTPLSAIDFQANSLTTGDQTRPAIFVQDDGDFVIAWNGDATSGSDLSSSIQAKLYNSLGGTLSTDFQVNTLTTAIEQYPAIAGDADGNFVVTWQSSKGPTDTALGILARRFDSGGATVGPEFQVNTTTTYGQRQPTLDVAADGAFVVSWYSDASPGDDDSDESIVGQLYGSDGAPRGAEFQVNSHTTDRQLRPWVSLRDDETFVVVWENFDTTATDGSPPGVVGRWLGVPVFDVFLADSAEPRRRRGGARSGDAGGSRE